MELIATGKWSKKWKRWTMVVAMRRPAANPPKRPESPDRRKDMK